jgi:type IV secretory pathway VirB10-like protein
VLSAYCLFNLQSIHSTHAKEITMPKQPSSTIRLIARDLFAGIGMAAGVFGIGISISYATDLYHSAQSAPKSSPAQPGFIKIANKPGDGEPPRREPRQELTRDSTSSAEFARALKLTPQQTTSVEAIINAERKSMQELRQSMRTKSEAIQSNTKQKLTKILNAEQLGRYEEWKEANRPPRPDGPNGESGRGPRRGDGEPQKQSARRQ